MASLRHVVSILMIGILMCSGLHVFAPEDVSHDHAVDLSDAILLARNFASTSEHPEEFSESLKKLVAAFHLVSGLTTGYQQNNTLAHSPERNVLDGSYLISSFDFTFYNSSIFGDGDHPVRMRSVTISPDTPPPRSISIA